MCTIYSLQKNNMIIFLQFNSQLKCFNQTYFQSAAAWNGSTNNMSLLFAPLNIALDFESDSTRGVQRQRKTAVKHLAVVRFGVVAVDYVAWFITLYAAMKEHI